MLNVIHYHFKEIGSTNTWAKEHAEAFPKDKATLVTADCQTAGRGRFKREWVSPSEMNIYATFCCFVSRERSDIGHLPQVLALAAAEVLKKFGLRPSLKWPNDVVIEGKKIAGILCETVMVEQFLCVIIGIGLNVNMPQHLLSSIDRPATSMLVEAGGPFVVSDVLADLQTVFIGMLSDFLGNGFSSFLEAFRQNQGMKRGDRVRFHDNQKVWEGFFHSINEDGSLTLTLDDGRNKTFLAGEFV